jgi:ketosteroid isomerase-like protein
MTDDRDPIEAGLRAWADGDLVALADVLAPTVTLRAMQPGPWDCTDREAVLRLLRERAAARGNRPPGPVEVQRVDEHTYVVRSAGPEPSPVATRVTVTDGWVTAMQQFRIEAAGRSA